MKNFGLLILGIIIGAIAMYFYVQQNSSDLEGVDPTEPKGLITAEEAKTLDRAYDPRYKLISDSIVTREGGDNRSSWYALEEVRTFLDYAEDQAKKNNYTMNGIRIYLGAYPESNEGQGYTTMFMMPTGYSANQNKSEGNLLGLSLKRGDDGDIPGVGGLNHGSEGKPPGANYPQ
ncbi:hypothetical protein ESY86_06260 [Subsaximicrobium wynnwilliamsii]|uniref:Uncharacterized protein n=1 Tax=Subsaximicrobium wynnwilliamsii TaxID=291179 RepID=A0A5C6ZI04_9FLAO|nr:hypothetical protein [Subsaximicrobium wynnwilliamsii]TXD84184.1 hypothetical protein ESY87_06675 [Subsaximicrobium wynnwilliamsii]TXD89805.1 hypothetical protein ESY86_06260 [Subsaximicrobium wynnwilliamsii]TXE03896.1 hypothetical protein ESY88_06670 [Subsaximicrobium wynnwilliamsii]